MRSTDVKIAGVCAGIAEYIGMDTTLLRIIYAVLTLFTAFCGIPLYLLLWLIMPSRR